jgi:hypothetical protein
MTTQTTATPALRTGTWSIDPVRPIRTEPRNRPITRQQR